MNIQRYTADGSKVQYHYKYSDLKEFLKLGFEHGDVGVILVKRDGHALTYKGFGTIENPCKKILTVTMMHSPALDGPMPTDDERLLPKKPFFTVENTKMMILDMSKYNSNGTN